MTSAGNMLCEDLMNNEIGPLKLTDSGLYALGIMDEFKVRHLPVVQQGKYIGLISEDDILDLHVPENPLESNQLNFQKPFVLPLQHAYSAVGLIDELEVTLIPVAEQDNTYRGYIGLQDLVHGLSDILTFKEPGGLLILEMPKRDYSLSEIAHIVEGNDGKIISSYVHTHEESTRIEVTLKINMHDLSSIISAFERHQYIIKASYHESSESDDIRDRFDNFMRYLNM
jgi:CBS domain-containing protein